MNSNKQHFVPKCGWLKTQFPNITMYFPTCVPIKHNEKPQNPIGLFHIGSTYDHRFFALETTLRAAQVVPQLAERKFANRQELEDPAQTNVAR